MYFIIYLSRHEVENCIIKFSFKKNLRYNTGIVTVSLNYTFQILHIKSFLHSLRYRTELYTTPFPDGFVSLIHGFSATTDFSSSQS
jgi:hypothetical protein